MHLFLKFIFGRKLCIFRTVPLSIIRIFALYTAVSKPVWHIPLLCVQWKAPDDGQRNCPKHAEFPSKNEFEKLLHLVGFIIRNLSQCMVTWMSNSRTMYSCFRLLDLFSWWWVWHCTTMFLLLWARSLHSGGTGMWDTEILNPWSVSLLMSRNL